MNYDIMKQKLDEIYRLVSGIPVKGEAVEAMAATRLQLRSVYQAVEAMQQVGECQPCHEAVKSE